MSVAPEVFYGDLLTDRPATAWVRRDDGQRMPLALERWLGSTSAGDEHVAAEATGPVLDVGCGPGRLLDALARRGKWAVGVDLSPVAVGLARRLGRRAVLGSIFDDPAALRSQAGAGGWATALLLDGNIGIGGEAATLLTRVAGLLRPDGVVIVEVDAPGTGTRAGKVRLELPDRSSNWFAWAHVDADGVVAIAAAAGLSVTRTTVVDDRWFAWLA